MQRWVSFFVLVAILVLCGLLFYRVMASFLLPLFLALVLVVIFRPLFSWLVRKTKGRVKLSAALTTLAILLVVLLPITLVLTLAAGEAWSLVLGLNRQRLGPQLAKLRQRAHVALPVLVEQADTEVHTLVVEFGQVDWSDWPREQQEQLTDAMNAWQAALKSPPEGTEVNSSTSVEMADRVARLAAELEHVPVVRDDAANATSPALRLNDVYFNEIRPILVQHLINNRLFAWLTLQANPTPAQLQDLKDRFLQGSGLQAIGPLALSTGQRLGEIVFQLLVGSVVLVVAVFYFLADGPGMADGIKRLAPLDAEYVQQLLVEFDKISRSVVTATLLSALVQGLLGGLGYWATGLDSVLMLTVLTAVLSLVPFVGATAVWLPCSLWLLLYEERTWAAVGLCLWGALVVSMVDNVIKLLILRGQSNLHPLLALLSVLGGVQALGPIGVFVGPMIVAFLQALLDMLRREMNRLGQGEKPAHAPPPASVHPTTSSAPSSSASSGPASSAAPA